MITDKMRGISVFAGFVLMLGAEGGLVNETIDLLPGFAVMSVGIALLLLALGGAKA